MFNIGKKSLIEERLWTVREIADQTGLSLSMVYKQVALGKLRAVRIGRSYRFKPEAVDEFLKGARQ